MLLWPDLGYLRIQQIRFNFVVPAKAGIHHLPLKLYRN